MARVGWGAALILLSCGSAWGAVPRGWQWTARFPFRELTVKASSEAADRWPAAKAIDGDTSEPDGLWQTERTRPKSAWLDIRLPRARPVRGLSIFHQRNPRYYRSLDYAIACWLDGAWKTVHTTTGNTRSGWTGHAFQPVSTDRLRITITRSAHGARMGLNEIMVDFAPDPGLPATYERLSPPYRCGPVADLGELTFVGNIPKRGTCEITTRTAPDAGGQPGAWSPWSKPLPHWGGRITSPSNDWIQYRVAGRTWRGLQPQFREITLGTPLCVERLVVPSVIAEPGQPFALAVQFTREVDRDPALVGQLSVPGADPQALTGGGWDDAGRRWTFPPVRLGETEAVATLLIGGARTEKGALMMHESFDIPVGTQPVLDRLRAIAEWMMAHEQKAIFVEGYNERTLLGLYEITGQRRYLDHVRKYVDKLLDAQDPPGFWGTGYQTVYFADTGSALGLFVNFYKFATPAERKRIDAALERYFHLLLVQGDSTGTPFVHEAGSVGVGFSKYVDGKAKGDLNKPYTISTALTGAEIFAAWYYIKGDERFQDMAIKACDWILDTMADEAGGGPKERYGQIPYIIDDWNPGRRDQHYLWERWPYDTSAYCGEGFIAAWTYLDEPRFRRTLGRRLAPHIDWLLRTQNADGSWAAKGSGDQLRSHGVVNLLLWYHQHIQPDPRIVHALRRYVVLLLDEDRSADLKVPGNGIATALAGRALVEIVRPGVDCYRWKDKEH
ncbi:MAG: discoidin domain-containing protein [Planctomycetota bacterium]